MFKKFIIDNPSSFEELSKSNNFEDICKGRKGAVLVDCRKGPIPIVRTTTIYNEPAQKFLPIHYAIMKEIGSKIKGIEFNNALIEIYTDEYCKMELKTKEIHFFNKFL